MQDFKRFVKSQGKVSHTIRIEKKSYVIFTTYEASTGDGYDEWGSRYVGIFACFTNIQVGCHKQKKAGINRAFLKIS